MLLFVIMQCRQDSRKFFPCTQTPCPLGIVLVPSTVPICILVSLTPFQTSRKAVSPPSPEHRLLPSTLGKSLYPLIVTSDRYLVILACCSGGSNRNHVILVSLPAILANEKIFFQFLDLLKIIIKMPNDIYFHVDEKSNKLQSVANLSGST